MYNSKLKTNARSNSFTRIEVIIRLAIILITTLLVQLITITIIR